MTCHTTILKAALFAAVKHKNQRRKDTAESPYINHPLEVALLIAETGGIDDPEILAAAILHDTVEDTDTTFKELEEQFGSRIRRLVEEVTDDKSLPKQERKASQVEHAKEISPHAALIKLGDKISNVKDVLHTPPKGWDINRRREYLTWAKSVIRNLPKVNETLEQRFADLTADGEIKLQE